MRLRPRPHGPRAVLSSALAVAALAAGSALAPAAAAPALASALSTGLVSAPVSAPRVATVDDPFYTYAGATPLADLKPGTVLKTREVPYSVQGVPLPLTAVQLLFRTADALHRPTVGATTVVRPVVPLGPAQVLSYQSFYDSLNPNDQPSTAIAGAQGQGAGIANAETAFFAPALLAGYTINIPDTEGQTADFAAGPEYGTVTIDSLRAISLATDLTGVDGQAPIGLLGYSGGAIGTGWAAAMVPRRAPAIARRIVGSAMGGVLVKPSTNLHYVEGSQVWAGVMPMALVGIARAYDLDLRPYANARGRQIMASMEDASIGQVLGAYPGLTWADIARKRYRVPESVPVYVHTANKLIMGRRGTPSAPLFIGQGAGGELEGTTAGGAGIGPGDGVMVAGDVRSLAREYCRRGVTVQYREYPTSHTSTMPAWSAEAYAWLVQRFSGADAPSSCGSIAPGNSLAPIKVAR